MSSSLSVTLDLVETYLAIYYLPVVYAVGTVGNLLNAGIFCHPKFRSMSCSWYFVCISLSHLLLLNAPCLSRIVTAATGYDLFARSLSMCKLIGYLDVLSLVLSRNFLCLICIDRWLVTSSHNWLRRLSSLRTAFLAIIVTSIFWFAVSSHAIVGFSIIPGIVCFTPRSYVLFYSLYNIIIAIVPFAFMILFSGLTLVNVRQVARRIQPSTHTNLATQTETPQTRRKRDQQFIRLALLQVLYYVVFNLLRTATPFVTYWRTVVVTSVGDERSVIYFIHFMGTYLLYTYAAVSKT